MSDTSILGDLIEPLVTAAGYQLYDVQQNGGTLAVLVQGPGGVDIDELSGLSRQVSALLDEHDPIPGRYTLQVSSPGVERRLRRPDHYEGAVGELVTVRTLPGPEGRRRLVGELLRYDDGRLTIEDREIGEAIIGLDEIEKAKTIFEWGPSPKPGAKNGNKSGSQSGNTSGSQSGNDTGARSR